MIRRPVPDFVPYKCPRSTAISCRRPNGGGFATSRQHVHNGVLTTNLGFALTAGFYDVTQINYPALLLFTTMRASSMR